MQLSSILAREMADDIRIERAQVEELPAVVQFLEANQLPTAGLADHAETLWVARRDRRIVGSIALEMYGHGALLRSAAVDAEARGHGLGARLAEVALAAAESAGVPAVYLLTTTAENYFPRFGFEQITRDDVPADVRGSIEFQSACPASAVVMRRRLTA